MVGQLVKYGAINQTNLQNPRLEQSRYRSFHSATLPFVTNYLWNQNLFMLIQFLALCWFYQKYCCSILVLRGKLLRHKLCLTSLRQNNLLFPQVWFWSSYLPSDKSPSYFPASTNCANQVEESINSRSEKQNAFLGTL